MRRSLRRGAWLAAAAALVLGIPPTGWASAQDGPSFIVVVHRDNPLNELPRETVAEMFRYRVRRWKEGDPSGALGLVDPVDREEGSALRVEFTETVHRKKAALMKRYWMKVIFSAKGRPPPTRNSDGEVLEFVQERPGAIGYVSSDTELPADVKELRVVYE